MRGAIFIVALLILSLGVSALAWLEKPACFPFFQGALTLGGGLLICFAFSLRMHWHGIIGAGVLSLLGFARGLGNLSHLQARNSTGAWMELVITLASGFLVVLVTRLLLNERRNRQRQHLLGVLEEEPSQDRGTRAD